MKNRGIIIGLILAFLVLGIMLNSSIGYVLADDDNGGDSGGDSGKGGSDNGGDSKGSNSNDDKSGSNNDKSDLSDDKDDSSGRGSGSETSIKVEEKRDEFKYEEKRKFTDENGNEQEIKIKIEERTENGETITKIKIKEKSEDEFGVETKLEIEIEEENNKTKIKVKGILTNEPEIKVLPETPSERAIEVLKSRNISVELIETVHKNIPRVVYNIQANKNGKFLGVFKLALKVETEIDPET